MRFSAKIWALVIFVAAALAGTASIVWSHCEIPCGIYGDKTRIDLLYEHIATIEKSMKQIEALQAEEKTNYNQLVRWISNKEKHAEEVQHMVMQYFMTQRVKPAESGDARKKYLTQLTSLHGMLLHAMRAKQTTRVEHCVAMRQHVDTFAAAYFSAEDLKHIREHHKGHK